MILQSINGGNNSSSKGLTVTIGRAGLTSPLATESSKPSQRRGSETDVLQRPSTVSAADVDVFNYKQLTASRLEYTQVMEMAIGISALDQSGQAKADNRYVCPFPACGKSFHSKEAAFRHLPEHEQRARLCAPTPLADSHLSTYWPSDVPWQTAPKFTQRVLPPGSWPCPVPGCNAAFAFKPKLELHTRIVHMKVGDSSTTLGYFKVLGDAVSVPPNPLPDAVQLLRANTLLSFCPQHAVTATSCAVCVKAKEQAQRMKTARPPFRMFAEGVELDMKARRTMQNLSVRKTDSVVRLSGVGSGRNVGVVVSVKMDDNNMSESSSSSENDRVELKARVVAVMVDSIQECWLCVEFLYTYNEAMSRGLSVNVGEGVVMDTRHELIRPSINADGKKSPLGVCVKWIKIGQVVNFHFIFM